MTPKAKVPSFRKPPKQTVAKEQEDHLWMLAKCKGNLVNGP